MPDSNGFELALQHVAPMVLLWPFLLAAGLYVLLRWVISAPDGGTSRVTVSQHALWIGVIGWLASSLLPAGNAGILPAGNTSPILASPEAILPVLAWPILGCLGVHAIGSRKDCLVCVREGTGLGDRAIAVFGDHRQRALRQVAEVVRQVRVTKFFEP